MRSWRITLSLSVIMSITILTITPAEGAITRFRDIGTSFAKHDILALHALGVVNGYSDGTFRPQATVTRAEFAIMLLKAKQFPITDQFEGTFRDAQRGEWFTPYAELSYRLGVTSGKGAQTFEPNGRLTREEMARMTVSALGRDSEAARRMSYTDYSREITKYLDRGNIASWAVKSMAYASKVGYLNGQYGYLYPKREATREEVAALLNRAVIPRPKGNQHLPVSSRGSLPFMQKQNAEATAYTHSGALSYIGMQVREGLVAVDPTRIPLGSHLFIPGYGYGIAGDTGGAIKQARVDLFHHNYYDAIRFGRQHVDVFILD